MGILCICTIVRRLYQRNNKVKFINTFRKGLSHNNKIFLNLPYFTRNINKIIGEFNLTYNKINKSNKIESTKGFYS